MKLLDKEKFLTKYDINNEKFEKIDMTWDQLISIFEDYLEYKEILTPTANTISEILRKHPDVHSVRSRIKNPEHLIEKIIRKSIEKDDYSITVENYKELITDLIGIRVLHLYKDQAQSIDDFIKKNWDLNETPKIYYREGDDLNLVEEQMKNNKKEIHPAGYRSWHYLIKTKLTKLENIAELQVRTIFEEGWSEIDHELRYPYNLNNSLLKDQLLVLNRVAGSADEMANTIRETNLASEELINQNEEYKMKIKELNRELEKALNDKTLNEDLAKDLQEKIDNLNPTISIPETSNYLTNIKNLYPKDIRLSDSNVNSNEIKFNGNIK